MKLNRMSFHSRSAFTVIELLVAISVIGMIIALLMPAVMAAREASRKVQCVNNLKQIGIAVTTYTDTYNSFPFINNGSGFKPNEPLRISSFSAFCSMLSFLDQSPLYNAVNFSTTSLAAGETPSKENGTVASTHLDVLLCPSDRQENAGWGGTNYRTNMGTIITRTSSAVIAPIQGQNGAFSVKSESLNPSNFSDGLSNTAGISEKLRGSKSAVFDPQRSYAIYGSKLYTTSDELLGVCNLQAYRPDSFQGDVGNAWMMPYYRYTYYSHIGKPNGAIPDCVGGWNDVDPAKTDGHFAARSSHPGLVNTMFMDGHVEPVRSGIDVQIWRALGTRDGNEAVSTRE